jgi:hypothetical protein
MKQRADAHPPAKPVELPAPLVAWRKAAPGRVISVGLRVTLWPGVGEKPMVFKTVDEAIHALWLAGDAAVQAVNVERAG